MVKESFLAQFYGKSQNYTDIPNKWYKEYNVKKGLRNEDGTGVRVGLTRVADVVGYSEGADGQIVAIPGELYYRGYNVVDLVKGKLNSHFGYEEVCFLLLFGYLPKRKELDQFCAILRDCYEIPDEFVEMNLLRMPGKNLMNKLQDAVLTLYNYDDDPDNTDVYETLVKGINLVAKLPSIACYAFGTAHRKHASTAVIADSFDKDHKMLGFLMEKEVKAVDAVLGNIKRPFTAIMGGSKVSTKIGIIENLLTKVDNLILCGGMTYTFSKALGGKIGMSICEDDKLDVALDVIKKAKENGVNLVLGTDSICGDDFKNDCNTQVCPSNNIPDGWEGMDAGPETRKAFAAAIKGAKTILWNGPAGVFEFDNFAGGSKAIAEAIAEATKEGAFSLIGGGDSVACINKFGLADQVSYISTGGGALLEAIEGKVLPGVAAIEK